MNRPLIIGSQHERGGANDKCLFGIVAVVLGRIAVLHLWPIEEPVALFLIDVELPMQAPPNSRRQSLGSTRAIAAIAASGGPSASSCSSAIDAPPGATYYTAALHVAV